MREKKILRSAQDDRGDGDAQEDREMCAGEQGKVRRRTRGRVAQHGIPLPGHRAVAFCHPGASSASVILRSAATKDLSTREPSLRGKKILRSAQDDRETGTLRMTGGRGRSGGQGAVRRRTKRDSQEDKGPHSGEQRQNHAHKTPRAGVSLLGHAGAFLPSAAYLNFPAVPGTGADTAGRTARPMPAAPGGCPARPPGRRR